MVPEGLKLNNPLWDYALLIYPPLAPSLLKLQTKGARINQLLAAIWLADQGRGWSGPIPDAIEAWHQKILSPRQARMSLKPQLQEYPELDDLYQSLKRVELGMERVELAMLYDWLTAEGLVEDAAGLLANLTAVLRQAGVPAAEQEAADLASEFKSIF